MKLGLLNTSIVTTNGIYALKDITLRDAIALAKNEELDSAIGHESTAQIMSELLGVKVQVNRQLFVQSPGQEALVFKLKGRQLEGKVLSRKEIEEIGYEFKILFRFPSSFEEHYM